MTTFSSHSLLVALAPGVAVATGQGTATAVADSARDGGPCAAFPATASFSLPAAGAATTAVPAGSLRYAEWAWQHQGKWAGDRPYVTSFAKLSSHNKGIRGFLDLCLRN
jgi:hypothetical protein